MIRTALAGAILLLGLILCLPWLVLWTILTGNPDPMYTLAMKLMSFASGVMGIRIEVEGLENIPAGPCVFVANHASNLDPFVVLPSLPRRVAILVKSELFKIPIFASAMRHADYVGVDRGDKTDRGASIAACVGVLRRGISLFIFPEGTRSPDGRLRPFKRGAFTIAMEAAVPIVPIAIEGTQSLLQKGSWVVRSGSATARFCPAIDPGGHDTDERQGLLDRVESTIAAALPPNQRPAA
jgi:1-acyl-sn-glycerol-3-phosphate acyltransferase